MARVTNKKYGRREQYSIGKSHLYLVYMYMCVLPPPPQSKSALNQIICIKLVDQREWGCGVESCDRSSLSFQKQLASQVDKVVSQVSLFTAACSALLAFGEKSSLSP